jgi:hypothetical protein
MPVSLACGAVNGGLISACYAEKNLHI